MAYSLDLPEYWARQGWKVKIRDRERNEPPHVTILHKAKRWRWGLRSEGFLDVAPKPTEVPRALLALFEGKKDVLRRQWDRMYPENPVSSSGAKR